MRTLEDLLVFVIPDVTNVSEGLAMRELRSAAREFCTRTKIWYEEQVFDVTAGQNIYPITVPTSAVLMTDSVEVKLNGYSLKDSYDVKDSSVLLLNSPSHSYTEGLTVGCVFTPSITGRVLPDELFEHYGEGICALAVTKLKRMSGKSWSDPAGATVSEDAYNRFLNRALINSARKRGVKR